MAKQLFANGRDLRMVSQPRQDLVVQEERVRAIAARATPLAQRLELCSEERRGTDDSKLSGFLMDYWRKSSLPEATLFHHRLYWDGLTHKTAQCALASWRSRTVEVLPPWVSTVQEYSAAADELTGYLSTDRCISRNQPLAFEEIVLPFVVLARKRLADAAGPTYEMFALGAHVSLERTLLKRLSWLCERALGLEFSIFRATNQFSEETIDIAYRSFVEYHRSSGLLNFFDNYPVLARLAAGATDQWVAANLELLQRLESDYQDLTHSFCRSAELGEITAVESLLSDLHNGGRSVVVLTFSSNTRIIYKPRDIQIEKCWNDLLHWINAECATLDLATFVVLPREGYGWAEYVQECLYRSGNEKKRLSRRAGMLLFLGYLLDATDLHHENIIFCGEHPYVIDLETLLHPWVKPDENTNEECLDGVSGSLRESVLRSGLLPVPEERLRGLSDLSGFGVGRTSVTAIPFVRWSAVNTDLMAMVHEPAWYTADLHPKRASDIIEPAELLIGFEELYQLFLTRRDTLQASGNPLRAFSSLQTRFVFRATGDYTRLLRESLRPALLRDGVLRSVFFEALYRVASSFQTRPSFWPILKAEHRALESMDVPLFVARSNSMDVVLDSGEIITNYFLEPGIERLMGRLEDLSNEDLHHQMSLIQGALDGMQWPAAADFRSL